MRLNMWRVLLSLGAGFPSRRGRQGVLSSHPSDSWCLLPLITYHSALIARVESPVKIERGPQQQSQRPFNLRSVIRVVSLADAIYELVCDLFVGAASLFFFHSPDNSRSPFLWIRGQKIFTHVNINKLMKTDMAIIKSFFFYQHPHQLHFGGR